VSLILTLIAKIH